MTTDAPTAEQIRAAWDALAPGFDANVSPYTLRLGEDIIDRLDVGPGTRVLDVAAGSGALAIPAARRGAPTVAVDIAPTMIERLAARAEAEGLSNLRGRVMDGTALEFPDNTFDVSVSLNGVSLFPDLDGGLAELVRVTKPGGRVAVVAFGAIQRTEFVAFFMSAIKTAVSGVTPPLDPPPLPFQVSDPEKLRSKLVQAGLTAVRTETATWEGRFRSASHYWDTVTSSNPIAVQLISGLTAEQRDSVLRVLDGMLRERSGGDPGAVLHNDITIGIGTK
ncbi:ubiquinone/menaquinone biosynthesis C-methylase UbiE [Lipingzhangella halophila]|uniref:Ubiquinone/menaquinone biosynthesis C-methylase UbiE n=1 Tax=Lipingzhangella halophila TaxID=1783352 RepID=A0A7W7RDI4_9ACTN|nr:methyltransferase domain-containing protein [Lipingzhangella halophila]MBB4929988.1 ubiquinone/menaquinone biosynthesis C-methylase UbiE [Lipingzhangella halophila]